MWGVSGVGTTNAREVAGAPPTWTPLESGSGETPESEFEHDGLPGKPPEHPHETEFEHLEARFRAASRRNVRIRCDIEILMRNMRKFDVGRATVVNVSATGMLLSNFKLPGKVLPVKPFLVRIRFRNRDLAGLTILAEPVRIATTNGRFGLGVRFLKYYVQV